MDVNKVRKAFAVILSGGVGCRMQSDIPKQYIEVNGHPIIAYCLEKFARNASISGIIIAVAEEWKTYVETLVDYISFSGPVYYSAPGEVRQETIYNALRVAAQHYSDEDIVIIHDAARPLINNRLIDACIDACLTYDGAMPVLPVKDTIYQSCDGETISSLLPRATLYVGQTPEAFHLGKYLQAHETTSSHEELMQINGSSEIAYKQGLNIKLIPGEESNFKITTPMDLKRFEQLIK